jgi:hypothetical protein
MHLGESVNAIIQVLSVLQERFCLLIHAVSPYP